MRVLFRGSLADTCDRIVVQLIRWWLADDALTRHCRGIQSARTVGTNQQIIKTTVSDCGCEAREACGQHVWLWSLWPFARKLNRHQRKFTLRRAVLTPRAVVTCGDLRLPTTETPAGCVETGTLYYDYTVIIYIYYGRICTKGNSDVHSPLPPLLFE